MLQINRKSLRETDNAVILPAVPGKSKSHPWRDDETSSVCDQRFPATKLFQWFGGMLSYSGYSSRNFGSENRTHQAKEMP